MDDLSLALGEHGVNVNKPDYCELLSATVSVVGIADRQIYNEQKRDAAFQAVSRCIHITHQAKSSCHHYHVSSTQE